MNIWRDMYWDDELNDLYGPHDDEAATRMHRLRGLVLGQAGELESILGEILVTIDPQANIGGRTAGQLLSEVKKHLGDEWTRELELLRDAIKVRNYITHNRIEIGSVWRDYATGDGGEWVPVVSTVGGDLYDESNLKRDLEIMQVATWEAVAILHALKKNRCG